MDGNILDSSVNVGVSEFQDFVEPLGIITGPEIVEKIIEDLALVYSEPFSIHAHFVEL